MDLAVYGPPGSEAQLYEYVRGQRILIGTVPLSGSVPGGPEYPEGTTFSWATLRDLIPWRCDRRVRTFVAKIVTPQGELTTQTAARTGSCASRVTMRSPLRARPGRPVRVRIADEWGVGGVRAKLCLAAPRKRRFRCAPLSIARQRNSAERKLKLGRERGLWQLELRHGRYKVRQRIAMNTPVPRSETRGLPTIILAGDSLMQQTADALDDTYQRRARIVHDVEGGAGLLSPAFDFVARGRARARLRAYAAAFLVGPADAYPIKAGDTTIPCCGPEWSQAYSQRVLATADAYERKGATKLVWALPPAMRRSELREVTDAVTAAVRLAAQANPRIKLVDLAALLTPGGTYTEAVPVRGRRVVVREPDGIHLTIAGARLAARAIADAVGPVPKRR